MNKEQKHKLMKLTQDARANLFCAEKEWDKACKEASLLGFDIYRESDRVRLNKQNRLNEQKNAIPQELEIDFTENTIPQELEIKFAKKIINHRKLSRTLTGGELNITTSTCPKKYAFAVNHLYGVVEKWKARHKP